MQILEWVMNCRSASVQTLCSVSDSMLCDNYDGNNMDDISVNTWLEEFLNLLNGLIVQTDQANHFLMSSL